MVRRSALLLGGLAGIFVLFAMLSILPASGPATESFRSTLSDAFDSSAEKATQLSAWMGAQNDKPSDLRKPEGLALNHTKVAVMIETRMTPTLIPILKTWLSVVPQDWPFVVWTSRENHHDLITAHAFQHDISTGRLNFTRIDYVGSPYRPNPKDTQTLSDVLGNDNWFWTQFHAEAEWMLFFQSDSILCSKSDQSVDDWLGFDYVGGPAPWSHGDVEGRMGDGGYFNRVGGNGGLSMRRISTMRKVTELYPRQKGGSPEDVYFAKGMIKLNDTRFPDHQGKKSSHFSLSQGWLEDNTNAMDWKPLGMHYGGKALTIMYETDSNNELTDSLHRLYQYCPEFMYISYAQHYPDGAKPAESTTGRPQLAQGSQLSTISKELEVLKEELEALRASQTSNGAAAHSPEAESTSSSETTRTDLEPSYDRTQSGSTNDPKEATASGRPGN